MNQRLLREKPPLKNTMMTLLFRNSTNISSIFWPCKLVKRSIIHASMEKLMWLSATRLKVLIHRHLSLKLDRMCHLRDKGRIKTSQTHQKIRKLSSPKGNPRQV